MKNKYILSIIIFIMCIVANINVYAEESLQLHYPTKEELGGRIAIPNREGGYDRYTDINTYEDLYSVLEDLSAEYNRLLEEYHSTERNYQELLKEAQRDYEELLMETQNSEEKVESDNEINISIVIIGIIITIAILYYISKK